MSINLLKYSLAFGFHVGKDSQYFNYKLSSLVIGIASDLVIFNINKTVNSIRTTLRFIRTSVARGSFVLYHFSSLFLYDYSVRLAFSNLIMSAKNFSIVDTEWRPGYLHSKNVLFFKMLKNLYTRLPKNFNWLDLFIRLFSYLYLSRLSGISWSYHAAKISKYFKMFLFFKHFKVLFKLPEIFFLWNTLHYTHPIYEMARVRSVVVSTVNTIDTYDSVTYPLFLNATSLWGALLLLKLTVVASK